MVTDQGATRGDGVFETMLAVGGTVRKLQAHLDRLEGSAEALDLVIPSAGPVACGHRDGGGRTTGRSIPRRPPEEDELVVKLVVTRGVEGAASPTCWVQVSPVGAARPPPARDRHRRHPPGPRLRQ